MAQTVLLFVVMFLAGMGLLQALVDRDWRLAAVRGLLGLLLLGAGLWLATQMGRA